MVQLLRTIVCYKCGKRHIVIFQDNTLVYQVDSVIRSEGGVLCGNSSQVLNLQESSHHDNRE
jgi:hypothetical protein